MNFGNYVWEYTTVTKSNNNNNNNNNNNENNNNNNNNSNNKHGIRSGKWDTQTSLDNQIT